MRQFPIIYYTLIFMFIKIEISCLNLVQYILQAYLFLNRFNLFNTFTFLQIWTECQLYIAEWFNHFNFSNNTSGACSIKFNIKNSQNI